MQILQKHYYAESGEILFNGKSINSYPTPLWRKYIGVVNQQTKIFNGSVGYNICLDNFEEKEKCVNSFCKEYGFDLFFKDLPQGLHTLLGENGVNISGGQQQLISIARALYGSPLLLLLDEPTSSMDNKTEQFVMDLIKTKNNQFAVILVTHKLQLTNYADRVYYLHPCSMN